jgi:4-hydroxybenzoyl-CoA reductase subunit alpha
VWAAHDCGRALNPVSVEGQIIGSVWMGMGQALTEEMVWKDGMLMNPGCWNIAARHRSSRRRWSPSLSRVIDPKAVRLQGVQRRVAGGDDPAIANAIYDAVGVRLHESPSRRNGYWRPCARRRMQADNLTEGIDPTDPSDISRAWGSLWFKGKGPERHALDPSRGQLLSKQEGDD